jgi:hypothetical protein
MSFGGAISRKYLCLLFLAATFFAVLPYAHLYWKLGYEAPKLPVAVYNDADYYFDRMQEVKDGYPFLGNPYFIEHREEVPPAFFLADWFSAIPPLLGVPLMATVVLNFFAWTFFFLFLAYLLLRVLDLTERWSFVGSLFVFAEVYLLMIRPVSMQVVFPLFLVFMIAYVIWLKDPENRKKQVVLALAAAFTAYIYTYAWQIVIVAFGLTPMLFFVTARRELIKSFFRMFGMFTLASLPLVLYTMKQIAHPLYWETMQRIGLVNTHVPTAAVAYVSIWIVGMLCLWALLSRYNQRIGLTKVHDVTFSFFFLLGIAMVIVTCSNVISGKDLELPQHIERFIVLWLGFASVYSCYFLSRKHEWQKFSRSALAFGSLCIAVIFIGNIHYLDIFGPGVIADEQYDFIRAKKIQGFHAPLQWLKENENEPTVIWADPNGPLRGYITAMTQHYVLFSAGGGLHLVGQDELNERFLVSHYFALTRDDLIDDYQAYGGVGNAYHGWKTYNRKVKLCRMFMLDRLGRECGELTDRESYVGAQYFTDLHERYQHEIRPHIGSYLEKYQVGYIIKDKETDREEFQPAAILGAKQVYSDGRFEIYFLAGL